jgi:hypothetical protein
MENQINDFPTRSNAEHLAKTILVVTQICQNHGIESWLCYGALLGMVREKRLLPWNNDAELGCWHKSGIEKIFKVITKELIGKGYNVYYYNTVGTLSVKHSGVDLNINCFWKEGEYAVRPHESPSISGSPLNLAKIFYQVGVFLGVYQHGFISSLRIARSRKDIAKATLIAFFRLAPVTLRRRLILFFYSLSKQSGGVFQKTGIPIQYFEYFVALDFYHGTVAVPKNSTDLLKYLYGAEWHIPKDKWSFYKAENKSETEIKFIDKMWNYRHMEYI